MAADSSLLMRVSVLMIMLIWSMHGSGLEATDSYGGRKTTQKSRIDSNSILRGLISYDLSRMGKKQQQYNEYMRMSKKLDGDRTSPGGPNRQHNNSLQHWVVKLNFKTSALLLDAYFHTFIEEANCTDWFDWFKQKVISCVFLSFSFCFLFLVLACSVRFSIILLS